MKIASLVLLAALSTAAHAAPTTLHCNGTGGDKGSTVVLTILNRTEIMVDGQPAQLDRAYNPRLNLDFLRFGYVKSQEEATEALVQSKLLDGEERGLLKVQGRGESFGSTTYFCHP